MTEHADEVPGQSGRQANLATDGFARYRATDICPGLEPAELDALLAPLARYCAGLPRDPNDPAANRYRRYGRAVVLPWDRSLSLVPGSPDPNFGTAFDFSQGDHNPEYPGTHRRFPYIDGDLLDDPLLRHLVFFDLGQVPWAARFAGNPVLMGLHLVTLSVAEPGAEAVSSPNCLHQDGGTFATYFVHLLTRDNAVGGVNTIASADCAGCRPEDVPDDLTYARFTLEAPLDSYAVEDPLVSHYVSPVRRGAEPRAGTRTAILIGLMPFVPHS